MHIPSIRWTLLAAGIGVSRSIAFSPWPDRNHQSSPSCRRVKICCWILSLYELCSLHAGSWKKRNKYFNKMNIEMCDLNFLVCQEMFTEILKLLFTVSNLNFVDYKECLWGIFASNLVAIRLVPITFRQ